MTDIDFRNSTELESAILLARCREATSGWAVRALTVRVRYSRGADFSGTCFYADRRIFVNLGRHVRFPYAMQTNLGRAKDHGRYWTRPVYFVEMDEGYDLVLFIFLHELYHLLIRIARRNPRQKESMCDRFAARYLVDRYQARVRTKEGRRVPREEWDFQDLDGFVAAARARPGARGPATGTGGRQVRAASRPKDRPRRPGQLFLFSE
jgi:hypothetical protein